MKILHLADLHIGKIIYEQSLIEDQKYILNEVIKIIKNKKIEVVLISGDIYDRSIPTLEAVELLNEFLNKLIKELNLKVFIISGNHDSKERLNFGSKIFESDGLYIQTNYEGKIRKVTLQDSYGPINIYMLPFIKPIDVKEYFEEQIITYDDAIKQIVKKENIDEDERNIIVAHQFVTSNAIIPETCESEIINIGGIDNVDASNFEKFDYVALGHIHGPQRIGRDTIRYSGTLLKYSFSEINHNKSVVVIDFKEKGNVNYELVPIEPKRDMREIRGPIEKLLSEENYKDTNTDDYISAIITNEEAIYDPIGQIRKIYPNVLSLEVRNSKTENINKELEKIEEMKEKSELELFDDFYEFQLNKKMDEDKRQIIKDIFDGIKGGLN